MKKIVFAALTLTLSALLLTSCGKSDAVKQVEALIKNIDSHVSLDSEEAIKAAQEAFDNLSEEEQGKVGNHKKVTVNKSVITNAKKLKAGKSLKLKSKAVKANLTVKKHRNVSYESTNPAVATVSKKGVIKGKSKGSCYIYAYAQNGVCKKVKVTVR